YTDSRLRQVSIGRFKVFGIEGFGGGYGTGRPNNVDLKIDDAVGIIQHHHPVGHSPLILIINSGGGRPGYLEMYFWLIMQDRYLRCVNIDRIFWNSARNIDLIDFVLYNSFSENPLLRSKEINLATMVKKDNRFKSFRKQVGMNGMIQESEDFIKVLDEGSQNFNLIDTVFSESGSVYYIYKRNTDI
ncbi:hypothetical protein ACFL2J_06960, partial [Candidatus Omnitrophota bacterium]